MASIQKLMAGKKKVVKSTPAVAATPAPAAAPAIKAVAPAPVALAPAAKQAAKPAAKQAPAATPKAPKTAKTADKSAPKAAANVVITKPVNAQPPHANGPASSAQDALEESSETPEYEVAPYCFSVINSEDGRGRKALGRFRDNLRKFYNMDETGLNWRDGPILELFCYDPTTELGYCRLMSEKHNGPFFESPKSLYETYNCSKQAPLNGIFAFCCDNDPDNGMELTDFLRDMMILTPDSLPPDTLKALQDGVTLNPMLAAYESAIEAKRVSKKKDATGSVTGTDEPKKRAAAEAEEVQADEACAKKAKMSSPAELLGVPDISPRGALTGPLGVSNFVLDESDYNKSSGCFSYGPYGPFRLCDLSPDSIEHAALCWKILSRVSTVGDPMRLISDQFELREMAAQLENELDHE